MTIVTPDLSTFAFPVQGDNGAYARAFGEVPRPEHCPHCWASEPECTEEPVLNTRGIGGNDPDNNGQDGRWYCWHCNREFGEDELDLAEPAECDHQEPES